MGLLNNDYFNNSFDENDEPAVQPIRMNELHNNIVAVGNMMDNIQLSIQQSIEQLILRKHGHFHSNMFADVPHSRIDQQIHTFTRIIQCIDEAQRELYRSHAHLEGFSFDEISNRWMMELEGEQTSADAD